MRSHRIKGRDRRGRGIFGSSDGLKRRMMEFDRAENRDLVQCGVKGGLFAAASAVTHIILISCI
jgi:hypothetical protein